MSNNQPKKLNLQKIGLLIVSATLIVLGRFLIEFASINLYLNNFIPADGFLFLTANTFAISWIIRGVGIALLCYVAFVSHFHVDRTLLKQQMRKQLVKAPFLVFAILGLLMISGFVEVPLARANLVNTMSEGWKITISMSYYDWWIGKLSDSTYFAMNGSDGNMLTFVEPWQAVAPWAAYTSNASALQELALAATTAGTVYLKEVAFDYDCTIPENVQVIENLNGLTRVFIDDGDSVGSPYTVSVDSVNPTYYTVQDSADRFIIPWTSTNASYVANSVIENTDTSDGNGAIIQFGAGVFTMDSPVNVKGWLTIQGVGPEGTQLNWHEDSNGFQYIGTKTASEYFLVIRDLELFGGYPAHSTGSGICLNSTDYGLLDTLIQNVFIRNFPTDAIFFNSYNTWAMKIYGNTIEHSGRYGVYKEGGSGSDTRIIGNKFLYIHGNAAILNTGFSTNIANNYFYLNDKFAIQFSSTPTNNVIANNIFTGNGNLTNNIYADIYIETGANNTIIGNNFFGGGTRKVAYAINLQAASHDNLVTSNGLRGIYASGALYNKGTNNIIHGNLGYITENTFSGTNTTDTTAVLAHGLASTPTNVVATGNDTALTFSVTAMNATYVTITSAGTPSGNWTVYCNAVYKP